MIIAVLLPVAVTSPADETVAVLGAVEFHVTVGLAIMLSFASFTVAVIVAVSPNDAKLRLVGDRVTELATWDTVTVAVLLAEPDVAVIVAVPSATDVTAPDEETVATDAAEDAHDTLAPLIVAPFWSLTVAESCCVAPIEIKLKLVGETVIEVATGVGVGVGVGAVGVLSPPQLHKNSESNKTLNAPACFTRPSSARSALLTYPPHSDPQRRTRKTLFSGSGSVAVE